MVGAAARTGRAPRWRELRREILVSRSYPVISCRSPFDRLRAGGVWRVLDARALGVLRGFLLQLWGIGHHGASVAGWIE